MRATETGFGLIEMMVVVLLIAILATIAVPSFRNLVAKTQVNSEANTLIAAFNTARSYAIRHNTQATLCAGPKCGSNKTLASGWAIKNKTGKIIRTWSAPSPTTSKFYGVPSHSVTYKPNGLPKNRPSGRVDICAGRQVRQVIFDAVGNLQLRSKNRNCAGCSCHP